jgi:hypothetical protein
LESGAQRSQVREFETIVIGGSRAGLSTGYYLGNRASRS